MKLKYCYRLSCKFESKPPTEVDVPNLQTAIQDGWRLAGRPEVKEVRVLRAAVGTRAFLPHSQIK